MLNSYFQGDIKLNAVPESFSITTAQEDIKENLQLSLNLKSYCKTSKEQRSVL